MTTRPKSGPGSRTKSVEDDIQDELDGVIFGLFPRDVLELPRVEFLKWRLAHGIRELTPTERARLYKIRRKMMTRRYARDERMRRIESTMALREEIARLNKENQRLRAQLLRYDLSI